jgi:ribosomal protein L40E
MERLRQSIAQLAAPICNTCGIEMAWSRSALIADEQTILHVFICARCGAIGETKTPVKASKE